MTHRQDSESDGESLDSSERVDELLRSFLHESLADRQAALEELCQRHQEDAPRLRKRFALLKRFGMLDAPADAASHRSESALPRVLGEYRLLRLLGRGGMSDVYLAEQKKLDRLVAVKLIKHEQLALPEFRERFDREARVLSSLEHPGICPVYDVGEADGVPFLAMRYLEGETLAAWIAARRDSGSDSTGSQRRREVARVLEWIEKVARALHAAHENDILHRDVKPANIMITREGGPVVLDFGLARDAGSTSHSLTRTGELLGTPAYMSPEQIESRGESPDRRTDVYSLGATLYECLALRPPFVAKNRESLYRDILTRRPDDPTRSNSSVPRDLAVVVDKAMAKDRRDRYGTALELAEDLARVRRFEPIHARAAGPILRLRRWSQRNRVAAVFLLLLSVGLVVAVLQQLELRAENRKSRALLQAEASARAMASDETLGLLLALDAVGTVERPETVSQLHTALAGHHHVQTIEMAHNLFGEAPLVSPDGRWLVTLEAERSARIWSWSGGSWRAGAAVPLGDTFSNVSFFHQRAGFVTTGVRTAESGSLEGVAKIWSAEGVLEGTLRADAMIDFAVISPDDRWVLTGSRDGLARLWREESSGWREIDVPRMEHQRWPIVGAFSHDGTRFVTGVGSRDLFRKDQDYAVGIWNLRGETQVVFREHTATVRSVEFAPGDSNRVLSASMDGTARIWDVGAKRCICTLQHDAGVVVARFTPKGDAIVTASLDGTARLWSGTGEFLQEIAHDGPVFDARFSADGARFVTASADMAARVFDRRGRRIATLRGHAYIVRSAAFIDGGDHVVTVGQDQSVRTWRLRWPEVVAFHNSPLTNSICCSSDGRQIVVASQDGTVRWYDREGHEIRPALRFPSSVWDVRVSPAAGERHWLALTWDARAWLGRVGAREPEVLPVLEGDAFSVAFHPRGDRILLGCTGGQVHQIGLRGQLLAPPIGENRANNFIHRVEYSASGDSFLAASEAGVLTIRDAENPETALEWDYGMPVYWATFSPKADRVLVLPNDRKLHILDVASETEKVVDCGETSMVHGMFSPDGGMIVTTSQDGARLWQADGTLIAVLRDPHGDIRYSTFTTDGEHVLTACSDGTVRRWVVDTKHLIALAQQRIEDSLTEAQLQGYMERLAQR